MKVLHILKSEPDEIIKTFMAPYTENNQVQQFELYTKSVDYDKLIELVFQHDKAICWW